MSQNNTAGHGGAIRRTAVHEAGHAVCAWYSRTGLRVNFTAVTAAFRGNTPAIGGVTLIPWTRPADRLDLKMAWDYLVTWMGGMAAEMQCQGDADPAESPQSDLGRACEMAGYMAKKVMLQELRRRHGRPGPKRLRQLIDREKLEKDAGDLVILALKDAGELLRLHWEQFRIVRDELLCRGHLDREDLVELIGRPPRTARRDH